MKIWHARESLNEINNLSAFLFTIAKNLALNAVRSHLREKVRRHKWAEEFGETYIIQPESIKDDPDPLEAAVAALPAQQQRVWLATRYEGKKLAEVADEMNLSLNTVKKYVRYAQDNITAHLIRQNGLLLVIALFWKK